MPLQYDSTMDMETSSGENSNTVLTNLNVKDNNATEFSLSDYYSTHGNHPGISTTFVPGMGGDVNMSDDVSEYLSGEPEEVIDLLDGDSLDDSAASKIEAKLNELFSTNKFNGIVRLSSKKDLQTAIKKALDYRGVKSADISKVSKNRDERFYKLGKILIMNNKK
jgi:hypothetical protein